MITNFKIFENEIHIMKYDTGDYVIYEYVDSNGKSKYISAIIIKNDNDDYDYKIEYSSGNKYYAFEDELKRFLTTKEIKEFETKRQSIKYNL